MTAVLETPRESADFTGVSRAVADAYAGALGQPAALLRAGWPFALAAAALQIAALPAALSFLGKWVTLALGLATVGVAIAFGLVWLRRLLLDEEQLQADRRLIGTFMLKTVLLGTLLTVAALETGMTFFVAVGMDIPGSVVAILLVTAVAQLATASYVAARVAMVLPATAIGAPLRVRAAWRLLPGGVGVRVWVGAVLVVVPIHLVVEILSYVAATVLGTLPFRTVTLFMTVDAAFDGIGFILQAAVMAGYLASLYLQVGGPYPEPARR